MVSLLLLWLLRDQYSIVFLVLRYHLEEYINFKNYTFFDYFIWWRVFQLKLKYFLKNLYLVRDLDNIFGRIYNFFRTIGESTTYHRLPTVKRSPSQTKITQNINSTSSENYLNVMFLKSINIISLISDCWSIP